MYVGPSSRPLNFDTSRVAFELENSRSSSMFQSRGLSNANGVRPGFIKVFVPPPRFDFDPRSNPTDDGFNHDGFSRSFLTFRFSRTTSVYVGTGVYSYRLRPRKSFGSVLHRTSCVFIASVDRKRDEFDLNGCVCFRYKPFVGSVEMGAAEIERSMSSRFAGGSWVSTASSMLPRCKSSASMRPPTE